MNQEDSCPYWGHPEWKPPDPRMTPELLAYCAVTLTDPWDMLLLFNRWEFEATLHRARRWMWLPRWLRPVYWWLENLFAKRAKEK